MEFAAIAALIATASAAGTTAKLAACTKTADCATGLCCGDLSKNSGATSTEDTSILAVKICYTDKATTFSESGTGNKDIWSSATTTDKTKTYKGTFKCLAATGAKTLSAAAVLAASYYMA